MLSAAGVVSNIENIGLEECGIVRDRGKIVVDDYYATNIPGYYAIGDCVPGPALAHVASAKASRASRRWLAGPTHRLWQHSWLHVLLPEVAASA